MKDSRVSFRETAQAILDAIKGADLGEPEKRGTNLTAGEHDR